MNDNSTIAATMYDDYAVLDAQIRVLEEQKNKIKVDILTDMANRGALSESHTLGKFTIAKLKTWTYPVSIIEAEEQVKAEKAKAQSTGDATYEESDSLRFISVKI